MPELFPLKAKVLGFPAHCWLRAVRTPSPPRARMEHRHFQLSDSKGKAVPVVQGWSSEEIQVLADGSKDTRYLVRALTVFPIISI